MLAAIFHAPDTKLEIRELPLPDCPPGHSLVEVMACGLCGSDLHAIFDQKEKTNSAGQILGHEIAGVVRAVRDTEAPNPMANARRARVGDAVVVAAGYACRHCRFCHDGQENICADGGVWGFGRPGGFAQFVAIPSEFLFVLPATPRSLLPGEQGISWAERAIIPDAVSTPWHALTRRARLLAGETLLVCGAGGLGLQAIRLARYLNAGTILCVDIADPQLELALAAGADIIVNAQKEKNWAAFVRKKQGGADVVLDFTGHKNTQEAAWRTLRRAGRMVLVGIGYQGLEIPISYAMIAGYQSLLGSFGSTGADIAELIAMTDNGRLNLAGAITAGYPLSEINQAIARLRDKSGGVSRLVVFPGAGV